jgi:hypothetical protein
MQLAACCSIKAFSVPVGASFLIAAAKYILIESSGIVESLSATHPQYDIRSVRFVVFLLADSTHEVNPLDRAFARKSFQPSSVIPSSGPCANAGKTRQLRPRAKNLDRIEQIEISIRHSFRARGQPY